MGAGSSMHWGGDLVTDLVWGCAALLGAGWWLIQGFAGLAERLREKTRPAPLDGPGVVLGLLVCAVVAAMLSVLPLLLMRAVFGVGVVREIGAFVIGGFFVGQIALFRWPGGPGGPAKDPQTSGRALQQGALKGELHRVQVTHNTADVPKIASMLGPWAIALILAVILLVIGGY